MEKIRMWEGRSTFGKTFRKVLLVMRISIVLLVSFVVHTSATTMAQTVLIKKTKTTYKELFKEIEQQTGIITIFNNNEVDMNNEVVLAEGEVELKVLYEEILRDTKLDFRVVDGYIVIKPLDVKEVHNSELIQQKDVLVRGIVTDDQGFPVPGVNIILKELNTGTITKVDGTYEIKIPDGIGTLEFSFIGFQKETVEVKGRTQINVQLKVEVSNLDDVVVTGYFSKKRDSYTGSATTFSGEELRTISTQNVMTTLAILDPGFQLIENIDAGSDPNHIPEFQIQGESSLQSASGTLEDEYGNSPNMPTFILDGFQVSAQKVFDLDPNRVKSMTILKDAAATAIYGSRAANGVVVVETIPPEMGELKLIYNGSVDLNIADLSPYNLMNAAEKLEYERLAGLYSTTQIWNEDNLLDQYNERRRLVEEGVNTDWMAIPLKDVGVSQKHALRIEGGDEKFRYGVDFNYRHNSGVMRGSSNTNIGTGVKLQYRIKNISIRNDISYGNVTRNNSPYGGFAQYTYFNPYFYPYNENGSVKKVLHDYESNTLADVYNPLYNTTLSTKDQDHYTDFTDNFAVDWTIGKGFRLKGNLSLTQIKKQTDEFKPSEHTSFVGSDIKGSYRKGVNESFTIDANLVGSYYYQLQRHLLNVAMVANLRETTSDGFSIKALNFPNDNLDHIGMAIQYGEGSPTGYNNIDRLIGYTSNINYSYDNRYLLDISVRTDGSSIYGADKRWGLFGSVGGGWNIHNEAFAENSIINELKLRGSIGTTGSNNFNPYQAMMTFTYNDGLISGSGYDDILGSLLLAYGNRDLKWQRTLKRNIGLDYGFFKSRITGLFNIYQNTTEGALIDVTLAPSIGFSSYKANLGSVQNTGFDFKIRGIVLKKSNMQWDLFLNATKNRNILIKLDDALVAFNDSQDESTTSKKNQKPVVRYMVNESIKTIWANESLGIDPSTGEEVFLDSNGKKTNKWSAANYKPMGNQEADVFGNFGTMYRYKKVQLNALFTYSYGGDIYNNTLVNKIENVNPRNNADKRVLYDRWKQPGDVAKYKAISNIANTLPTSRFIEQENYIWLKSVNLTYTLGAKAAEKLNMERIRLSLITNDIFRWSTVKQERGIDYPFARTYSLSAQLTF